MRSGEVEVRLRVCTLHAGAALHSLRQGTRAGEVSTVHPGDPVNGGQRGAVDRRERVNAKRCEERNEGEKDGLTWPCSHGPCKHVHAAI